MKEREDVTEVEGLDWFSFIQDPTVAVLELWTSRSK